MEFTARDKDRVLEWMATQEKAVLGTDLDIGWSWIIRRMNPISLTCSKQKADTPILPPVWIRKKSCQRHSP